MSRLEAYRGRSQSVHHETQPNRRPRAGATAGHTRTLLTSMICVADGHDHWVSDNPDNAHRYQALCGRLVIPAALVTPPGPACPGCVAMLNDGHRQHRSPTPGVLALLTGFASTRGGKHRRNRALRSALASWGN